MIRKHSRSWLGRRMAAAQLFYREIVARRIIASGIIAGGIIASGIIAAIVLLPGFAKADSGTGDLAVGSEQATIDFLESTDNRFRGMYARGDFSFYVPPTWTMLPGNQLELDVTSSDLLRDASLTIEVNQLPIKTVALPLPAGLQTIEVPVQAFVSGWNVLTLRFLMRTQLDPCRDLDNPGIWSVLGKSSRLQLRYRMEQVRPDLSLFPDSYMLPDKIPESGAARVVIAIPQHQSAATLTTAMALAWRLGRSRQGGPGRIVGTKLGHDTLSTFGDSHIIIVGSIAEFAPLESELDLGALRQLISGTERGSEPARPNEASPSVVGEGESGSHASKASGGDPDAPVTPTPTLPISGAGYLREEVHPKNASKRLLVVTSGSEAGLLAVAAFFSDSAETLRLQGVAQPIFQPEAKKKLEPSAKPARVVRFGDIVGHDLVVRGSSEASSSLRLPVPSSWKPGPTSALELEIDYSIAVGKMASLEIAINDRPVYTLPLLAEMGDDSVGHRTVRVFLPETIEARGMLELSIRLYVERGNQDCSQPYDDSIWAAIRKDSSLELEVGPHRTDLDSFPRFFHMEGDVGEVGFVVGDDSSEAFPLTAALSAAAALGGVSVTPEKITAMGVKEFAKTAPMGHQNRSYLIVVSRSEISGVERLLPDLKLVPQSSTTVPELFRNIWSLSAIPLSNSVIEIIPSPWDNRRDILVAAASDAKSGEWMSDALSRTWNAERLGGTVTLLTDATHGYQYRAEPAPVDAAVLPSAVNSRWAILLLAIAGFSAALFLYLMLRSGTAG